MLYFKFFVLSQASCFRPASLMAFRHPVIMLVLTSQCSYQGLAPRHFSGLETGHLAVGSAAACQQIAVLKHRHHS